VTGTVASEQSAVKELASAKDTEAEMPPAVVDEYRGVYTRVEVLRRREQELLLLFTPENARVKDTRAQLADAERQLRELETQHPPLARSFAAKAAATPSAAGPGAAGPQGFALELEAAQLNALDVRVKTLLTQMDTLRKEAVALDQLEGNILELTRKRQLEEANYQRYSASLEQSRINEALGSGKVSNISVIQTPTPPAVDPGKTAKIAGGIAAGGLALGVAWAFLIEMLLDRSIRRPAEVERLLRIPLFLSIPRSGPPPRRGWRRKRQAQTNTKGTAENAAVVLLAGGSRVDPPTAPLNPYFETLRDRLIGYFESRNLTHKPKLVAMTGIAPDSGVTTMATGLARCLSETGDGNVLLVDLTPGQGSAQYFHHGNAGCGLEELLETRANAKVEERLFVASDGSRGEKLSRILPQRFAKLLPQLKSSDFDYIIFDMPPVSQISITPRLAGFMDMVLLVVESEKNSREGVQRASALLAESNAHVGAVLNKTRNYVPNWVHQELPV
jgi:Mrp family chromosome partitioning ATPase